MKTDRCVRIGTILREGRHELLALFVALAAVAALAALVGVSWAAGWDAVLDRLRKPQPEWFAVALGAEVLAYAGYVLAYREVARVERGPELRLPQAAAIVAAGFGVFVATGGFFVDTEALEEAGVGRRQARTRAMGLGALEYVLLAPAAAIAGVVLLWQHAPRPDSGLTWPWVVAVPAGFVLAGVALSQRRRLSGSHGVRRYLGRMLESLQMLVALGRDPLRHGLGLVGMAAYWFGDIACLWACLQAFEVRLPVPALIVGYATGYALTRRTLPLGGAGIVEALLPFALLWSGSPLAAALLGVFTYRVFNLWLPILPALVSLPTLRRLEAG
ncbi:MAG: hypothetical protein C5B48_06335 [Candidatus Rokuibacteriota bacterium]|nr:MAG: hypothetical protein C5B48_06335 [Candidatus Rokubacteria bacterium]